MLGEKSQILGFGRAQGVAFEKRDGATKSLHIAILLAVGDQRDRRTTGLPMVNQLQKLGPALDVVTCEQLGPV